MKLHKVLERQLRKHKLSVTKSPSEFAKWQAFLKSLSNILSENDEGFDLLERSLEITSDEVKEKIEKNKKLNLELAQASKLVSLGTLASGVAHELNNPLQIISGFSDLILLNPKDSDHVTKNTHRILEVTKRMAETINYLLKFSHKEEDSTWNSVLICEPILETSELLNRRLKCENINLLVDIDSKEVCFRGSAGALAGVFHNLITNSRDAFMDSDANQESRYVKISTRTNWDEETILVTYEDNAGGIPDAVLEKIFDPFFTTKQVGEGTGLGLSLSRNTIENFRGTMKVEVEGDKTRFYITLPLVTENEISSISKIKNFQAAQLNQHVIGKRVLVVDDEPDICELISFNLQQKKMKVTGITSFSEAKKYLQSNEIDLLLTDYSMPEASGMDLCHLAKKHSPDCKLIIFSGNYIKDEKVLEHIEFLKKPLRSEELFGVIDRLLV